MMTIYLLCPTSSRKVGVFAVDVDDVEARKTRFPLNLLQVHQDPAIEYRKTDLKLSWREKIRSLETVLAAQSYLTTDGSDAIPSR